MGNKILTFEMTKDGDEVEIHGNEEGFQELIEVLSRIIKTSEHDHLMTPAWGGCELTEEKQGRANTVVNKVTIRLWH